MTSTPKVVSGSNSLRKLHVAVVGAGIVGLAVAYHLVKEGADVTVIDRDPDGDKASFGNAGGLAVTEITPASVQGTLWRVCGWMLDPLGPLAVRPLHAFKLMPWLARFAQAGTAREVERISRALAAINARVYEDLMPMLRAMNLTDELHRNGALCLYESEQGYRRDAAEWACRRSHGFEFHEMTRAEAQRMEPALGARVHRAVFMPQWAHFNDPRSLTYSIRDWLIDHGVKLRRGEVRNIVPGATSSLAVWVDGNALTVDRAVVAAGAWSGILAQRVGDQVLLESERGYNMTLPRSGISLTRELVFAERKFVATPLSCGLRIGGAAEFGGLHAAPNFKRSRALVELARQYLPDLQTEGGTSWAGHRPATPDSLPVIGRSQHQPNVFYAFGHGHLGLTLAATTGRLVSDLIFQRRSSIDMTPYDIGRFSIQRGTELFPFPPLF